MVPAQSRKRYYTTSLLPFCRQSLQRQRWVSQNCFEIPTSLSRLANVLATFILQQQQTVTVYLRMRILATQSVRRYLLTNF